MKLLVLNPNTTAAMTATVVAEARRLARAGVQVRGVTAARGPAVIASRASFAEGERSALETLHAQAPWADAVLLACFGDPGLAALQAASPVPVAGMAQCAFAEAAAGGRPFHVITAGAAWDAMLREEAERLGHGRWLQGITVLDTTGADVARRPEAFLSLVQHELDALDALACVLAGSGFAGMLPLLRHRGALIDGVGAAMRSLALALPLQDTGRDGAHRGP